MDLHAGLGLVLAAAQFAFDADVGAFFENGDVLRQFAPVRDTVPLRALLAPFGVSPRGFGSQGPGCYGSAARSAAHFRLVADEADQF